MVNPFFPGGAATDSRLMTLDELVAFGRALGEDLSRCVPSIVTLEGDLGAGKTTLTRAISQGFGIAEPVTSPTYSLVHEYVARGGHRLFHLDLYRITKPQELENLGWDDMFREDAALVVEWPDRAAHYLPDHVVRIRLEHVDGDDDRRRVSW